jgi:hypothetical protein
MAGERPSGPSECCHASSELGPISTSLSQSYFINQERNTVSLGVLPSSGGAPGKVISSSVSRKGTRNGQQPLVNVSALTTAATPTQAYAFEPGSLLAKR